MGRGRGGGEETGESDYAHKKRSIEFCFSRGGGGAAAELQEPARFLRAFRLNFNYTRTRDITRRAPTRVLHRPSRHAMTFPMQLQP